MRKEHKHTIAADKVRQFACIQTLILSMVPLLPSHILHKVLKLLNSWPLSNDNAPLHIHLSIMIANRKVWFGQ